MSALPWLIGGQMALGGIGGYADAKARGDIADAAQKRADYDQAQSDAIKAKLLLGLRPGGFLETALMSPGMTRAGMAAASGINESAMQSWRFGGRAGGAKRAFDQGMKRHGIEAARAIGSTDQSIANLMRELELGERRRVAGADVHMDASPFTDLSGALGGGIDAYLDRQTKEQ